MGSKPRGPNTHWPRSPLLSRLLLRGAYVAKPEATCNAKRSFATWLLAESALWQLLEDNWNAGRPERNRNLTVYRCYWCSQWHIGHNGTLLGKLGDLRRTGTYERHTDYGASGGSEP